MAVTPSLFPLFMKATAGGVIVDGYIIIGGLEVGLTDSASVEVESSFEVREENELLVPADSGQSTVTVENELDVGIEVCE